MSLSVLTMFKPASLAAVMLLALSGPLAGARAAQPDDDSFTASFAPFAGKPGPIIIPPHAVNIAAISPRLERRETSLGRGVASYYGKRFAGRRTANGERFDPQKLTAAHKTLPFGSRVRVTNPRNGRSVVVRINDRGPFIRGREIDLSRRAAERIGLIQRGHGPVDLALLKN